jgi:DNA-binding NarL/FixJ family response regulator
VAFESADAPGYDPAAGRRLELLLPAFEAGVEQWRRLGPARSRFASLLDTLSDAVVIVDADGTEQYSNRAFRALLAAEPDAEALQGEVRTLSEEARAGSEGLAAARHEFSLAGGTYRLRASRTPPDLLAGAGTLVVVERVSRYPSPSVLQEQFGLTPREAEVTLLLAEGRSNDAIAEALVISPHTVRHHVQKVLRKLGASSRAAVAHVLLHHDSGPSP